MRPVCELLQHRNRTELILGKNIPRNVQSLNDKGFVQFGEIYGFEEVVADTPLRRMIAIEGQVRTCGRLPGQ